MELVVFIITIIAMVVASLVIAALLGVMFTMMGVVFIDLWCDLSKRYRISLVIMIIVFFTMSLMIFLYDLNRVVIDTQ